MVVYIDVLLFVNLLINALLLSLTARIVRQLVTRWRLALAAAVGALFSLVILLPRLPFVLALLLKWMGAATMCLIAFPWHGVRALVKSGVCLFVVSSLVAGAAAALSDWTGGAVVHGNLSVYLGVSPLLLIGAALICYLCMAGFELIFGRPHACAHPVPATVMRGDRSMKLMILIDSGSSLCEPITGKPVLLVDARYAQKLLDGEALQAAQKGFSEVHSLSEVFAVPYSSVGGSGVLMGFGGVSVQLDDRSSRCRDGMIAAFCEHIEGADAILPLFSLED